MRLLKAFALLRNPDAKVISVAEECGFSHLGLFNTCFKRRFGTSPGQCRKRAVPSGDPPARLGGAPPNCVMRSNGLCPWSGQPERRDAVPQPPSPTQPTLAAKASMTAHALNSSAEASLLAGQQDIEQGASTRAFATNR